MEFNNIDLILNTNFEIEEIYPQVISQYSTNYKLRVVFTNPDFKVDKLILVLNNGSNLPAKTVILSNQTMLVNEVETYFYEYVLTQYDTQKFVEELGFTVTGYDENNTEIGVASLDIQMVKADFAKISPNYLQDETSANNLIIKSNDLQDQINDISEELDDKLKRDVINITNIETIYSDISELPVDSQNGTIYPALTEGILPLKLYKYNSTDII